MRECRHLKDQGNYRKNIWAFSPVSYQQARGKLQTPVSTGLLCIMHAPSTCGLWGMEVDPELNYPGACHHFKVCKVPRQALPILSLLMTQKGMGAQSGTHEAQKGSVT